MSALRLSIVVMAELFMPLLVQTGRQLEQCHGARVDYLSFLPRDRDRLRQLGLPPQPPLHARAVAADGPDDATLLEMTRFMRAKHGGSDAVWLARCRFIDAALRDWLAEARPDAILLWNGQDHVGRLLTRRARAAGIPLLYLENGYLPDTLQVDAQGVNAESSLCARDFASLLAEGRRLRPALAPAQAPEVRLPPPGRLQRLRHALAKNLAAGAYYARYPEERLENAWERRRLRRLWQATPVDSVALPPRYVFIPLQVHDDTQVLINGRHFRQIEPFVESAIAATRAAYGPDMPIVVKEHPVDVGRTDHRTLRERHPQLLWLRKYDIDRLLAQATAVVVLNSSVGLQALQGHKPTLVYGEAFYARPEIAFPVTRLEDLAAVAADWARGVDAARAARIDGFIAALHATVFLPGRWNRPDPRGVAALARRLADLAGAAQPSRRTAA